MGSWTASCGARSAGVVGLAVLWAGCAFGQDAAPPSPAGVPPASPTAPTPGVAPSDVTREPRRGEDPLAEPADDGGAAEAGTTRTKMTLTPEGGWTTKETPAAGTDAATIARARRLLAEGKPRAAQSVLDAWLDEYENSDRPQVVEAFLLRGDAKFAGEDEYEALYDYERVIKDFPSSPEFVTAVERELDIALLYLNGLKRKMFGLRIDNAETIGEELLMRVQERMPGSQLAERAGIELADYYYRERELKLASDAYDIFARNFPNSEYRQKAMQRRVFSNIARFKGPEYDASGLIEAQFLIRDYAARYPEQAERIGMDDALTARLDESAAAQMLTTAEWYLDRGDAVSTRFTLTRLLKKHPGTVAALRGLEIFEREGWPKPGVAPAEGAEPARLKTGADRPVEDLERPAPAQAPAPNSAAPPGLGAPGEPQPASPDVPTPAESGLRPEGAR